MSNPLVSLTVICYKAEKYIREAIDGALSQTYSPLEIIFSDDCSPDNTFKIIEESLKDYKGPHSIVLNKNETNLGIGVHVSKVWYTIAKGDWIVVSAGDDVSLPNRVEKIMDVATPDVAALHHNYTRIDENGNELPDLKEFGAKLKILNGNDVEATVRAGQWLIGSTMCLNKKMLLYYKPFVKGLVNEDIVLAYRAQHFGKIVYLHDKLFLYRIHFESSTNVISAQLKDNYKKTIAVEASRQTAVINQIFEDHKIINFSKTLITELENKKRGFEIDLFVFDQGKFKLKYLFDFRFYKSLVKRFIK